MTTTNDTNTIKGEAIPFREGELRQLISSAGVMSFGLDVWGLGRNRAGNAIAGLMAGTNPATFLQRVYPTASRSSAEGFAFLYDPQLWDLLDEMTDKDTTIASCLSLLVSQVMELERRVEPKNGKKASEFERSLVDQVERHVLGNIKRNGFDSLLYTLTYGRIAHGTSVNEIVWEFDDEARKLVPRAFIHRPPGMFMFDAMGNAYVNTVDGNLTLCDTRKFCIVQAPSIYGSPWPFSPLFGLRFAYFIKKSAITGRIEFVETHGTPLLVVKLPDVRNGATGSESVKMAQDITQALKNLRAETALVLTKGEEVEAVNRTSGANTEGFDKIIRECDEAIVRSLLGATLGVLEAQFGTRAQAEVHERVQFMRTRPLAIEIQNAVQRVIEAYVRLNYGESAVEYAPVFVLDIDERRDVKEAIEILRAARDLGISYKTEQAYEWLGLERPEPGDETAQAPPAASPPAFPFDKAGQDAQPDSATMIQERESIGIAEHAARKFSEAQQVGAEISDKIIAIGDIVTDENKRAVERAWKSFIRANKNAERYSDLDLSAFDDPNIQRDLYNALSAGAALAFLGDGKQLAFASKGRVCEASFAGCIAPREVAAFADADPDDLAAQAVGEVPSIYQDGVRWMIERKVLTVPEVRQLTAGWAALRPDLGPDAQRILERALRSEVEAIAVATNTEIATKVRNLIASSVNQGNTVTDFLEAMDDSVKAGTIPAGLDSYLTNVYRTETSNVYGRQREANFDNPALRNFLWGYEIFNPKDARSRDSHAAVDGLRIRRGSQADAARRPGPPWSYQCRCSFVPLIVNDVANQDEYEEPANALELVNQIERF